MKPIFLLLCALAPVLAHAEWLGSAAVVTPGSCSSGKVITVQAVDEVGMIAFGCEDRFPAGMVTLVASGACPAGWSEVTALSGKMLRGTLSANGNVGTMGGSDTATPAGTVSQPTLAMNSYTPAGSVAAPTFTGSSATSGATSAGTPAGTVAAPTFTGSSGTVPAQTLAWPAGVPTFAGSALATHQHELPFQLVSGTSIRHLASTTFGTGTSRAAQGGVTTVANTTSAAAALSEAKSAGTPAGTVAWPAGVPTASTAAFTPAGTNSAPAFTGSALATHTHTVTATGTNSAPAFTGSAATLTGSVTQPTFTGSSLDVRAAYVNVIFCSKN